MAESSLSIGYPDLIGEVGRFLGYDYKAYASYDSNQQSILNSVVQSGIRNVYYPKAVVPDLVGYEWSWLRPSSTITIEAPYDTGTIVIVNGVVTLTTGTFPSWTAGATLSVDGTDYVVDTRDGDSQVTLTDLTVDVDAGTSYTLTHSYIYDLPDDFGRLISDIFYPEVEYRKPIRIVSTSIINELRSANLLKTGYPECAAVRYKSSTGASGQRQEIIFYPTPNDGWEMTYEYEAYSGVLSTTYPYPLGGMQLAELYIESCLAVAELRVHDEIGIHNQTFQQLLIDAIKRDMKRGPKVYGDMDVSEEVPIEFRRGYTGTVHKIYYKGNLL